LPQQSEFREAREKPTGRVPPSDVEAEKAVLSALLLECRRGEGSTLMRRSKR
jgi:hypothetical protein